MEEPYARRSPPQRFRFATAALLILWSLASVSTSFRSSVLSETRPSAVPLHAADIIQKCKALRETPGPPADFINRTQSDRFQPGTRPILIRNASLWTGHLQGLEVVQGDLYIDNGLIKVVGHVDPNSIDPDNVHVLDAHGYVALQVLYSFTDAAPRSLGHGLRLGMQTYSNLLILRIS